MSSEDPRGAEVTTLIRQTEGVEEEASRSPAAAEFKKRVVVIMPFGGQDSRAERRCILDYMRIRHLIETKVEVSPPKFEGRIHYDVRVCRARVGEISSRAFRDIAEADIVVALLTERNVNVTYELAVRNLIKPEYLMIIKGEPNDVLPVYLRDMAYIQFDRSDADGKAIEKQIAQLAEQDFPLITWDDPNIPQALEQAIERHDHLLKEDLLRALSRLEQDPPSWPRHMIDLAEEMHPGGLLKGWTCYNPTSLVRIRWRTKKDTFEYDQDDLIGEPVVCDINNNFARLYNFVYRDFPDPDGPKPLTCARLLKRIEDYVLPQHMRRLEEDQGRVSRDLIFQDKEGTALVPIQFNDKHPHFPNKIFLPSMIGKRTIGSTDSPHTTYLLIAYIDDFWPIDYSGGLTN